MTTSRKNDLFDAMEKKYGRLTFGTALRSWRLADEQSQVEFARLLKMSVQSLCDLEKGRRIPTPGRAAKIARRLGIPEVSLIQLALRDVLFADGFRFEVRLEKAVS